MNFDDTPQEAEFRAVARAWIAANAPKQYEDELRKSSLGRTQLKNANILEVAKAVFKAENESLLVLGPFSDREKFVKILAQ